MPIERVEAPGEKQAGPLEMVPLGDGAAPDDTENAPASATSFFAMPQPKRKKPEEPKPAAPPASGSPAAPSQPAPPQQAAPPSGGLGIQGPVASGPVAGSPQSGSVASGPTAQEPSAPPPGDTPRTRSYRVFAVVMGLLALVFSALLIVVGLTVYGVWYQDADDDQGSAALVPAAPRQELPPPADVRDTGEPAAPEPAPTPPPKPASSSSAKPKPRPSRPATGPAPVSVRIPPDQPFTSIEVNCPSGYRKRAAFEGGRATLPDVPREDCTVNFKGGPPARNRISGGQDKTCTFPNAQAVCR